MLVPATKTKTIALFCCLGLVASLCLMTFGIDLSDGWL